MTIHSLHPDDQAKLRRVIAHLEATTDDQWITGVCRSKDGIKNCVMGHVFAMGKDDKESNQWWNWFEDYVATTFMVFAVNDGKDGRYPQGTPKERCLAYLRDILTGRVHSSHSLAIEEGERLYPAVSTEE